MHANGVYSTTGFNISFKKKSCLGQASRTIIPHRYWHKSGAITCQYLVPPETLVPHGTAEACSHRYLFLASYMDVPKYETSRDNSCQVNIEEDCLQEKTTSLIYIYTRTSCKREIDLDLVSFTLCLIHYYIMRFFLVGDFDLYSPNPHQNRRYLKGALVERIYVGTMFAQIEALSIHTQTTTFLGLRGNYFITIDNSNVEFDRYGSPQGGGPVRLGYDSPHDIIGVGSVQIDIHDDIIRTLTYNFTIGMPSKIFIYKCFIILLLGSNISL
ncbi:hypothetical protein ACJX0J_013961 [Zea mays]